MTRKEFEQIVPRLRPLMVRVGRDFFGNKADAEDIAQEGLVRLWQYCEQLDSRRNLEALAVKVAKNVCLNLYRSRQETESISDTLEIRSDDSPDKRMITAEVQQEVDEAIGRLKPRERTLFVARHVDDEPTDKISTDTGISKSSVQSIISMAKKKLFKDLKKHLVI